MSINLSSQIGVLTTFFTFVLVIVCYPFSDLHSQNGIGALRFLALFLVPAFPAVLGVFVATVSKNTVEKIIVGWFSSIIFGFELAFALLSIAVLFFWYDTPDNSKLEPLFIAFGVAAASAEGMRRILDNNLKITEEI